MQAVASAYGAVVDRYVELFGDASKLHDDDLQLVTRHLSIRPGVVLDVGCGPGHLTSHLRSLDVDAVGIDLTAEFIAHARRAHPDGRFEVASMQHLPVPDRSAAGVLAWYSLIHVPPAELDVVLRELRRVLVPGGPLVVGFFDGDERAPFDHEVITAHRWPVDELADRLRAAGFAEVDRQRRPGTTAPGDRAHAALVAVAT